jgi:hypothetical protein
LAPEKPRTLELEGYVGTGGAGEGQWVFAETSGTASEGLLLMQALDLSLRVEMDPSHVRILATVASSIPAPRL